MSQVRAINVLTLSAILFLAGCFGFGDSAEADDDEITVSTEDLTEAMILASNSPPDLSVKKFDHTYILGIPLWLSLSGGAILGLGVCLIAAPGMKSELKARREAEARRKVALRAKARTASAFTAFE